MALMEKADQGVGSTVRGPSRGRVDVGHAIRSSQREYWYDCACCGRPAPLKEFMRFETSRGGLPIAECECLDCGSAFKVVGA